MPSKDQHIQQALRNEAISAEIESLGHHDWAVTPMFYAVLHWTDAYLAVGGKTPHPAIILNAKGRCEPTAFCGSDTTTIGSSRTAAATPGTSCVSFGAVEVADLRARAYAPAASEIRKMLKA